MHRIIKRQNAFTLLEVIFAIVILGIVASIGSRIIVQVYQSYIVQRALYRANIKTTLALDQIGNRLRYIIPGTVGTRDHLGATFTQLENDTNASQNVLQWVAYDGDSFEAISSTTNLGHRPLWSGFCDLSASTNTAIATPGSRLDKINAILGNLSNHTKDLSDTHIFFSNGNDFNISGNTGKTTLNLTSSIPASTSITERYKLAWTSYALVCENSSARYPCGDLRLYYNFTPQKGAAINGSSSLLLRKVSNFRFKNSPSGAMRIKICKEERIGADTNSTVTSCKEKVVF